MVTNDMREFYDKKLELIGAEFIEELTRKTIVVRLNCGHERVYNKSTVYKFLRGQKTRCHKCRMKNAVL